MNLHHSKRRNALTLAEVLALLSIVAFLLLLLWPALMAARERDRKSQCQSKLGRLLLAVSQFESTTGAYPSGATNPFGPIVNEAIGMHHSWITQVLPYLDQAELFAKIDPGTSVYDDCHSEVRQTEIPAMMCPASPQNSLESSYAGCHHDVEAPVNIDNSGVFFLNSSLRREDIVDGLEYTFFLAEKRSPANDLGWMSGTRATLRNTGTPPNQTNETQVADRLFVGGFGSWHSRIVLSAMGSGVVNATSVSIDPLVYRHLGNRRDGDAISRDTGGDALQSPDGI